MFYGELKLLNSYQHNSSRKGTTLGSGIKMHSSVEEALEIQF